MERRHLRNNWLDLLTVVIRLALGCLFLWSSLSKIQLPHDFLGHVYAYRLVGPVSGMFVGMVLPWLELLVGACLLAGVFVGGALLASMGMGVLFTFVLALGLVAASGHQLRLLQQRRRQNQLPDLDPRYRHCGSQRGAMA